MLEIQESTVTTYTVGDQTFTELEQAQIYQRVGNAEDWIREYVTKNMRKPDADRIQKAVMAHMAFLIEYETYRLPFNTQDHRNE